jgi:hypothetical protein
MKMTQFKDGGVEILAVPVVRVGSPASDGCVRVKPYR